MVYGIVLAGAWLVWHLVFPIKVVGRENLPRDGRGFVLAPNHLSAIDPVFVVIARFWGKKMLVMAKEEVMHVNPFFTWFFHQVGVFGVTRGRGDTSAVDNAIEEVKNGRGLLIFPEGTRSKTGEPIPAEKLFLGEHKSAAKLRENKQLLLDAWQKLYEENRFE